MACLPPSEEGGAWEGGGAGQRTGTWRLAAAALPTAASHTGFTGLPWRRGEAWPQAIHYKLVQGGQDWRSYLHTHPSQPQVEILCSSQDGPQSKHWTGNSISFCLLGDVQWVPGPLSLTFPHLATKLLD